MKRPIYSVILLSAVMAVLMAVHAFGAPVAMSGFESVMDFSYDADAVLPEASETDADENRIPILFEGITQGDAKARLMAEEDERFIYLNDAWCEELCYGMEEFEVGFCFDDVCDAKYNLEVTFVDENGKVVAESVEAEYSYYSGYGWDVYYTMKVLDPMAMEFDKKYYMKLNYTGSFDFLSGIDDVYTYLEKYLDARNRTIVDSEKGIISMNIYGILPDEEVQIFCYNYETNDEEPVEILSVVGSRYTFQIKNPDECYEGRYEGRIFVENRPEDWDFETWWYAKEYEERYGKEYEDWIEGVDFYSEIALDQKEFSLYLFEKEIDHERNIFYNSADSENFDIYILDGVTCERVAELKDSYYYEYENDWDYIRGEFSCTLEFSKTVEDGREYFLIVDDGYTIRIARLETTTWPIIEFCGFNDGVSQYYYSDTIPCSNTIYVQLFGAYNIPDVSKLSAITYDYAAGKVVHMSVPSSMKQSNGNISFRMRAPDFSDDYAGKYLYFELYYDEECVYGESVYCDPDFGNDDFDDDYDDDDDDYDDDDYEDYWFEAYVERICTDSDGLHMLSMVYNEGVNFDELECIIYDYENNKSYPVTYNVFTKFNDYESLVVFNSQFDYKYDHEYCFVIWYKDEVVCEDYIYVEECDEIDEISLHDGASFQLDDGYTYFFTGGLSDGDTYKLCHFSGEVDAAEISASKVPDLPFLKVKTGDLVTLDHEYSEYVEGVVEANGVAVGTFEFYKHDLPLDHIDFNCDKFFAKYYGQDNRFAVLRLPTALYTEYKLALSEAGLKKESYNDIRDEVIFTLPDVGGKYKVYAQFKDENGKESEIMSTTVYYTKPEVYFNETPVKVYYDYEYGYDEEEDAEYVEYTHLYISPDFETNFTGYMCFYLLDDKGDGFDWEEVYVEDGKPDEWSDISFEIEGGDLDVVKTIKVYIYGEIDVGGYYDDFEREFYLDFEFAKCIDEYDLNGLKFTYDNCYKGIFDIESELEDIVIPSSVDGKPVTYFYLDSYFCPNVKTLKIPKSVTSIDLWSTLEVTFIVFEGSYSHEFAEEYGFDYELVTYTPGDVNNDDSVDLEDAIYLLQHSLFADDYPLEYGGDVDFVSDGSIDLEDAIYLLQYSMFPEDYPIQ